MPGLSSNAFLLVVVSLLFLSYFATVYIEKNIYLYNRNVFRSPKIILANSETYERFQALANQSRIQVQFLKKIVTTIKNNRNSTYERT